MCEAVFVLSLAIIILFFVGPLVLNLPEDAPLVTVPALIFAVLGLGAGIFGYFTASKYDNAWISYGIFALFSAAVIALIITTGGVHSPFVALFLLIAFFSGIFSYYGSLPLLILTGIYVGGAYVAHDFTFNVVLTVLFTAVLPLIAGFIVWYGREAGGDSTVKKEVKQIASQLSEVASVSEVIINAIGDGVIAMDSQGTVQLINPAAQKLLGWSKQDAVALNYKSVLSFLNKQNNPIDNLTDPVQQALNTNQETRTNELSIGTKSGQRFMAAVVVSPISDQAGSGVIAMFHDITKEKKEEREQAEFISTASHEMRTPVASIEGYLGLALNPNTSQIDDKARDFIMKAQAAAQHLGRLFQDLLDVSKSEDGRMANTPKVVDIVPFVGELVQGLTKKATDKGLRIKYPPIGGTGGERMITPVYFVNLDNDHLREVTNNLIENAIKYTLQGEVVVDVSGTEDRVVISVKDSGIGIPPEDISHLFQKFYRVDNEETNQIGGTGLGLYLCRRLVDVMGGRIWVESEYKKGSTFFVELPRISGAQAEALKAEQANQITAQPGEVTPVTSPDGLPPVIAAPPAPIPETPKPDLGANGTEAATTVPRGELLSDEQKAAHVARLKAMIEQQKAAEAAPPQTPGQTPS